MKIKTTVEYDSWIDGLKDQVARARIMLRTDRMKQGNLGVVKGLGEGLNEAKIDYGPGHRLYYAQRYEKVLLLLIGGTKRGQQKDIEKARKLLEDAEAERWWEDD